MAEWLKAHAWKACKGVALSWVRIPFSPPLNKLFNMLNLYIFYALYKNLNQHFFLKMI